MIELGGRLAEQGYTVSIPRLPGHGTTPKDFRHTDWEDWYRVVDQHYLELRETHDKVFVAGFSLGGLLGMHLAAHREVDGLALMAPALGMAYRWYYIFPVEAYTRSIGFLLPYFHKSDKWIKVNDRTKVAGHLAYSKIPTRAARSLMALSKIVRGHYAEIDVPVLTLYSEGDDVVSSRRIETMFEEIASTDKKILRFNRSNHLITLDFDKDEVFDAIESFFDRLKASDG